MAPRAAPSRSSSHVPAARWDAREAVALALLLLLVGALLAAQLDHFMWDDDESVHVLAAEAVRQGYPLYDTVWFGYTPGFLYLLAGVFSLTGPSLMAARAVVGVSALAGLALTALLARRLGGRWSGVAAVALLAPVPHVLVMSSAVLIEVPAMALVTAATLCAALYIRRGRRGWLAASGALVSLALLLKPTVLAGAVVPVAAALLVEPTWRRRLGSLALLAACGLTPLLAGVLLTNPSGFWEHVVLTYIRGEEAVVVDYARNAEKVAEYLFYDKYGLPHASLVLLAGVGLGQLWREERRAAVALAVWLLAVLAVLLTHAPLYRHHLVQVLFPLAALAGVGLAAILGRGAFRPGARALLAGLLLLLVVETGAALWIDLFRLREIESDHLERGQQAVAYLREHTAPGDYVITDAHILALRAGRQVPPELTETSRRRIRTGQLTSAMLIELAERYHPAAIVFWEEKLEPTDISDAAGDPDYLDPTFAAWVAEHYELAERYSERHRIYIPR